MRTYFAHNSISISKNVAHGQPDVFTFGRVEQKLLSLPLSVIKPVTALTVVYKGTFYVHSRGPLHEFAPFCRAKVPHGLHILVFRQVFVRPILEYAVPVWCPFLVKDIVFLEKVQRRASRQPLSQKRGEMDYEERCSILKWSPLKN